MSEEGVGQARERIVHAKKCSGGKPRPAKGPNFRERRVCELRRITLPRRWVNKPPIKAPNFVGWHHDGGKGGQTLFTAQLEQLELFESWSQEDPRIASKSAIVLSSREGSASTQVFYIVCEPNKRIGRPVHSTEEVLLVLKGTAEVSVGDERARLSAGSIALIPAGVPHEPINVGSAEDIP
jgi:quercetin dioxygenase-like cupin family protein